MSSWIQVLQHARDVAKMHTNLVPLAELNQWGLRFTDGLTQSFQELAKLGFPIDAVVRLAGGFYEHRGAVVSPNGREAAAGWQQTANVVVPEDSIGIIALVVDTSVPGNHRFLVECREEPFAFGLPGQVVASASVVASQSNREGAHGYSGNPTYLALLRNLVERVRVTSRGDMGRFVNRNEVVILEWCPKAGLSLPNLDGKHYTWVSRRDLDMIVSEGIASIHLLEAFAVYALYVG